MYLYLHVNVLSITLILIYFLITFFVLFENYSLYFVSILIFCCIQILILDCYIVFEYNILICFLFVLMLNFIYLLLVVF